MALGGNVERGRRSVAPHDGRAAGIDVATSSHGVQGLEPSLSLLWLMLARSLLVYKLVCFVGLRRRATFRRTATC
jgi:hypothetical protein